MLDTKKFSLYHQRLEEKNTHSEDWLQLQLQSHQHNVSGQRLAVYIVGLARLLAGQGCSPVCL